MASFGVGMGVFVKAPVDDGVGVGVSVMASVEDGVGVGVSVRASLEDGVGVGVSMEASDADGIKSGVARGLDSFCRQCQYLKEQEDHCMQLRYSFKKSGKHTCSCLLA